MGEIGQPELAVAATPEIPAVVLTAVEVRVLGALVEKQITTPDYYPLTVNALVNACNQTSSRDPVVNYDEPTVALGLDRLRDKRLAYVFAGADNRVLKYGHKLMERFEFSPAELAALCVLLLRGPQTPGEIRGRTGRMHEFVSVAEAEAALDSLATRKPNPLATRLPRSPGTKEARFAHLLGGPVTSATEAAPAEPPDRVAQLEQQVGALRQELTAVRQELAELRQQSAAFRQQFE